ncbi:hypothetical protein [Amycolatopsis sp. GM8]|uniref:hypothetical protein n=1 Tax=Amycolatopsis sp. GM8 TaxID=2896530 RepID=UPI001F438BF8|nr:hypothetical protein [Amycolatopsis sp. GM8]
MRAISRWSFSVLRRHWKITIPTGIVVVAGIALAIVMWVLPDSPPQAVVYTNVSANFKACLLSTTRDADDSEHVWPAIQAAGTRAAINAQHITAPAGTSDQLVPYLNSLISLHCGLIITAGTDLTQPALDVAKTHPQQRFLIQPPHDPLANVDSIPSQPDALTALVAAAAPTTPAR